MCGGMRVFRRLVEAFPELFGREVKDKVRQRTGKAAKDYLERTLKSDSPHGTLGNPIQPNDPLRALTL